MSSNYRTADQVKIDSVLVMGNDLGQLFNALWQQVALLHQKWEEYVTLFGVKQSRLTILNNSAPSFFRIVQDALWEDVLLHIARLTDPPESYKKQNLSILRLIKLIECESTREMVKDHIDIVVTASEFCRDWRNRHIAHRDLDLALDNEAKPLIPASRKQIDEVIQAISAVLNIVSHKYKNTEILFKFGKSPGGAISLLYILDDGLKAESERRERRRNGQYTSADHLPREL